MSWDTQLVRARNNKIAGSKDIQYKRIVSVNDSDLESFLIPQARISDAVEGISYLELGEVQAACKQSFTPHFPLDLPFTVYK